jgi:hypothetical protein
MFKLMFSLQKNGRRGEKLGPRVGKARDEERRFWRIGLPFTRMN